MILLTIILGMASLDGNQTQDWRERRRAETAAAGEAFERANPSPADWSCAQPMIDRNYERRDINATQLALRISDECARPVSANTHATLHAMAVQNFVLEIESRIHQARRRSDIDLH